MWQGFEWDPDKAESNIKHHDGVTFEDAQTVFDDPLSRTIDDIEHSSDEDRFVTMGHSVGGALLIVCHCDRDERIRIISARRAEGHERKDYQRSRKAREI